MSVIPRDLVDQIKRGNCILFAGAGVSHHAKPPFPLWPELLLAFADALDHAGVDTSSARTHIEDEDLLKAADLLCAKRPTVVHEALRSLCNNRMYGELHSTLARLPFRAILTTNFDHLFEATLAPPGGSVPPVLPKNFAARMLQERPGPVIHIHGVFDRPETLVLTQRDYDDLVIGQHGDAVQTTELMTALFLLYPMILVGYSLSDPDIQLLLKRLQRTNPRANQDKYLMTVEADADLVAEYRDKYGIQLLAYGGHHELLPLFRGLLVECSPTATSTSNRDEIERRDSELRDADNLVRNVDTWVFIPGGRRRIGTPERQAGDPVDLRTREHEGPTHEVYTGSFEVGKFHVTVGQYRRFVDASGYDEPRFWDEAGRKWRQEHDVTQPDQWGEQAKSPGRPIVGLSFYEAMAYCSWLCETQPPFDTYRYSLMTEAEWEYVARDPDKPYASHCPKDYRTSLTENRFNCARTPRGDVAPVGSFSEDASRGVMDLNGNVREWVHPSPESFDESFAGEIALERKDGKVRARGGSFKQQPVDCRIAHRHLVAPSERLCDLGFRVKRTPLPVKLKGDRPEPISSLTLGDFFAKRERVSHEECTQLAAKNPQFTALFELAQALAQQTGVERFPWILIDVGQRKLALDLCYQDSRLKLESERRCLRLNAGDLERLLDAYALALCQPLDPQPSRQNRRVWMELTDGDLDALVYATVDHLFEQHPLSNISDTLPPGGGVALRALSDFLSLRSIDEVPLEQLVEVATRAGTIWWPKLEEPPNLRESCRGFGINDLIEFRSRVLNANKATTLLYFFSDRGESVFDLALIVWLLRKQSNLNIVGIVGAETTVAGDADRDFLEACLRHAPLDRLMNDACRLRFEIHVERQRVSGIDPTRYSPALMRHFRQNANKATAAVVKGVRNFEVLQRLECDAYYAFTVHSEDSQRLSGLRAKSAVFAFVPQGEPGYECPSVHEGARSQIHVLADLPTDWALTCESSLKKLVDTRRIEAIKEHLRRQGIESGSYRAADALDQNGIEQFVRTCYGIPSLNEYKVVVEGLVFVESCDKLLLELRGSGAHDEIDKLEGVGGYFKKKKDPEPESEPAPGQDLKEDVLVGQALRRELGEELGEDAQIRIDCLLETRFQTPTECPDSDIKYPQLIFSYLCRLVAGTPTISQKNRKKIERFVLISLDELDALAKRRPESLSYSTRRALDTYKAVFEMTPYYKPSALLAGRPQPLGAVGVVR